MNPEHRLERVGARAALLCVCLFSACHSTTLPGGVSSETHFLMRCDGACADGLACICGVCTASCQTERECRPWSAAATCRAGGASDSCSQPAAGQVCDLTCKADADCVSLSSAHYCDRGYCRRDANPSRDSGVKPSDAGLTDAGDCTCSGPRPLSPNMQCSDGSIGGPICSREASGACSWTIRSCPDAGQVACQPSECLDSSQCSPGASCIDVTTNAVCVSKRCCPALGCNPMCANGVLKDTNGCDTCQCAPASSTCNVDADCPALELCAPCGGAGDPCAARKCIGGSCQWSCADAPVICGSATCAAGEICCDHCTGSCVNALSGANCPDGIEPGRSCNDSGSAACAQGGESCVSSPCCGSMSCCSGQPFPPGTAVCYATSCPISDRNMKADIRPAHTDAVLEGVLALPIANWHYKAEAPDIQHIGPMAQDFKATFGVGADDKHIFQIDADGVSFAAIQALNRKLEAIASAQRTLEQENGALHAEIERLRGELLRSRSATPR